MAIWGKTSGEESRPKSLPMDSNSIYSREFVTATSKGWVMQPGLASAATGNDNAAADPEILVAIRNLSVNFKSGNLLSVDFADGAVADSGTFDLVLTFDEEITGTSATRTANQVVTVNGAGSAPAASITSTNPGSNGQTDTSGSTDNTITITAVASQTSFTVSENVTIADDINLLFSADAGEGIEQNSVSMALEGADGATSVVGESAYRTGFGLDTIVGRVSLLEDGDQTGSGNSHLVNEDGNGGKFSAESFTTDATGLVLDETKTLGSASGSAFTLKGVTTA